MTQQTVTQDRATKPIPTTDMKRVGDIHLYDTGVHVWEEHVDERAMQTVFFSVLSTLRSRGFMIERDRHTLKNYTSIADSYWYGRKGDLEFNTNTAGRTIEVEFYQNVLKDKDSNPNGGRYDFDKFKRMPRILRTMVIVEMTNVIRRLLDYGYTLRKDDFPAGRDRTLLRSVLRAVEHDFDEGNPLAEFNRHWGKDRFNRDEAGWPTLKEYTSGMYTVDRDKQPILNGDTLYFRDHGRLMVGKVYPSMGNQWQVRTAGTFRYMSGHELFRCLDPSKEPRRFVPGQTDRMKRELAKLVKNDEFKRAAALAYALHRRITKA
jgi:hypothetical protein